MNDVPADGNKTVFRPSPLQGLKGGARPDASPPSAAPPPNVRPSPLAAARLQAGTPPAGQDANAPPPIERDQPPPLRNAMLAAASPILALAAGLRGGRIRLPLAPFHRQATQAIADLDAATQAAYPEAMRQRARYALCATLDDIAQNLPGQGNDGAEWARRSLVVQAFQAPIGGERFWQLVDEATRAPAENRDLAELLNACLAAGFEDRYRTMPDGKRQLHDVMARLQGVLRRDGAPPATELSPHWRGEQAPIGRLGIGTPLAVVAAAAAAGLLIAYIVLRLLLLHTSAAPSAAIAAIVPEGPLRLSRGGASVAPPPASHQASLLRAALAAEIAGGALTVEEDAATVRVRTTVGPLFAAGSDQLVPERAALLARIGDALSSQPGEITVEDHVAGDGGASLAFPDAVALSAARADKAAALIKRRLTDPARVKAKGMGGTVPLAANTTADGQARNDRIEVVLPRTS